MIPNGRGGGGYPYIGNLCQSLPTLREKNRFEPVVVARSAIERRPATQCYHKQHTYVPA
jgi:hypothetical protein